MRPVTELHSWCPRCGTLDAGGVFEVPHDRRGDDDDDDDSPRCQIRGA